MDDARPFGCIVPGLPPLTHFTAVGEQSWTAAIGFASETLVMFLTGTIPVPDGQGLGVYLSRADQGDFAYLGYLTNERASALFHPPASFIEVHEGVEVIVGLTLQPLDELDNLGVRSEVCEQQRAATHLHAAQKIADDLLAYVLSYAKHVPAAMGGADNEDTVMMPASWMDHWRKRIETKMALDRLFLTGDA